MKSPNISPKAKKTAIIIAKRNIKIYKQKQVKKTDNSKKANYQGYIPDWHVSK